MNKKIIIAATLLAVASSSAIAAEGKYYVKGNIGSAVVKEHSTTVNGIETKSSKKSGSNFIGTLSVGSNLSSNIRSDLEVMMDNAGRTTKKFTDGTKFTQKLNSYLLLLNAHYDIKNSTKLTPFVTVGFGYGHNKSKGAVEKNGLSDSYKSSSNGFAYQAGLGASYNIGKVDLELGYRYIDKGMKNKSIKKNASTVKLKKSSGQVHAIMAGVRVGF